MFPDTNDSPALTSEGFSRTCVPLDGSVDLTPPVIVAFIFQIMTLLAAVPEAAIHEDYGSFAWKDEIWSPTSDRPLRLLYP